MAMTRADVLRLMGGALATPTCTPGELTPTDQ